MISNRWREIAGYDIGRYCIWKYFVHYSFGLTSQSTITVFYACWINPLRNDQFGMSVVHHWVCMSICYDIHNTFVISDSAGQCSLNSRNISDLQIMTAQWQESLSILDFCNKNANWQKKRLNISQSCHFAQILEFSQNILSGIVAITLIFYKWNQFYIWLFWVNVEIIYKKYFCEMNITSMNLPIMFSLFYPKWKSKVLYFQKMTKNGLALMTANPLIPGIH